MPAWEHCVVTVRPDEEALERERLRQHDWELVRRVLSRAGNVRLDLRRPLRG